MAALDRGVEQPLTLVSAPAGSGKSALVSAWVKQGRARGPIAWLSLDASDGEPARFWHGAVTALARAAGDEALAALAMQPPRAGADVLPGLAEAIDARRPPLTLVLDDFQEAAATTQADVGRLLRFPVGGLRLILLARADPQLGLSRLRLQGRMAEIRAGDLAFTREETAELLASEEIDVTAEDVARLWRRTEGWAAALRLAAVSLKGHPEPAQFVERFTGTDATVSDYLISEVLARQPPELREFMLRTSLVDMVSADLADALTADSSGHRLLSLVEHGEALIGPVDGHGEWHRYHPLFAELLRAELQWERPDEVDELHRRAAVWLAAHGDESRAARHAARAGAWDLAAELVCDRWVHMLIDGELGALRPVLDTIPRERVEENPELALALGGLLLTEGDDAAAARHFGLARDHLQRVPARRRNRFAVTLATSRLYESRQRGNLRAALTAARLLLAEHADLDADLVDGELRALVRVNLGIVELWAGELDAAVDDLQRGHAAAVEAAGDWLVLQAAAHLALAVGLRGQLSRAVRWADEAIELAARRGWSQTPPAGAALTALAGINVQRGALDEADRLLMLAATALRGTRERPLRATHALARVLALADRGEPDPALDVLLAARDELGDWPLLPALRDSLAAQEALLRAALGERDEAREQLDRALKDHPGSTVLHVARARLALLDGDARGARELLAPTLQETSGVLLSARTEAWLLDALALDTLADHDGAARSLERALDLAEPAGLRRAIVMHGPAVRPLLNRHRRGGTRHPVLVGEALEAVERGGARRRPALSLRELLSDREEAI